MLVFAAAVLMATVQIEVAPARIRVVPPQTDLRQLCRTDRNIEACTKFLGETLRCECRRIGSQWKIAARAQFIPYVYLSAPREDLVEHEEEHVEDLREQVTSHLHEITSATHPDRETCESVAEFERATFGMRMDLFRRLSNRKLH